MVCIIIAAAGQGKRMSSGTSKVFIPLLDKPVLVHSVLAAAAADDVGSLIVTASAEEIETVNKMMVNLDLPVPWQVVAGGIERQHSIANALAFVPATADVIVVHDGARPLADISLFNQVVAAARQHQAAIIAVPVKDTIKSGNSDEWVTGTPDRRALWAVQTPQAFAAALLQEAYRRAAEDGYLGTDDASLVERMAIKVKIVTGNYENIKITTPEDLSIATTLLVNRQEAISMIRSGIGYDVHRLVPGRKLIVGGVDIPHTLGLDGHSDADVLLHAIKDALLGAAALGDIGRHFPDTDERYKGISSLKLLGAVRQLLAEHGFCVNNIDATIVAQKPKLAPYITEMNQNIAKVLRVNTGQVNVKATTSEGLGFAGAEQGIAAYATATIIADRL